MQGKTHAWAIGTTEEASALALQIVDAACQAVQGQDGQLRALDLEVSLRRTAVPFSKLISLNANNSPI